MTKTLSLFAFALLIQLPLAGHTATVLDFESLYHDDDQVWDLVSPYVEDGFQLVNTGVFPFATYGAQVSDYSGSTALINDNQGGVTILSRVSGAPFRLVSIDLAELIAGDSGVVVEFTGILPGLGTVNQRFVLDGLPGAQTFAFSKSFEEVTSVSWANDSYMHQFDNIVLPVPATPALVLAGLGLFGGLTRGRRRWAA